jgi:hypothetical protein
MFRSPDEPDFCCLNREQSTLSASALNAVPAPSTNTTAARPKPDARQQIIEQGNCPECGGILHDGPCR